MNAIFALAAVAGLSATTAPAFAAADDVTQTGASRGIYDSMELGFKLCSTHIIRQGHLATEHSQMLAEMGVSLVERVPAFVHANGDPLFLPSPIYAKLETRGADVYIATSPGNFACRVIVAETRDALAARIRFVDALRETPSWNYDQRRSRTFGGQMREELTAAGGRLITIVNGPNTVAHGGKGVQAFITVAVLPPNAPADH